MLVCGAVGVIASCHDGESSPTAPAGGGMPNGPSRAIADATPGWTNQPSGLQPVSERAFSALSESGWHDGASANFSIVDDSTAPRSALRVGEARFPTGFASGNAPMTSYVDVPGQAPAVYMAFWLELSPNFQGIQNRILWFSIGDRNRVILSAGGTSNSGTLRPVLELRNAVRGPAGALAPNVDVTAEVRRGQWQKWEVVIRANSAANADGAIDLWVDGTKSSSYGGIQFVNATEGHSWQSIAWAPYWNGSGSTVPAGQYMRMDHAYVAAGTPVVSAAPVASVSVTSPVQSLVPSQTAQLGAVLRDSAGNTLSGRALTWSSSAGGVATVSSTGLVTAQAPGTATITATSEGRSGSVDLSVAQARVASVRVSPATSSLSVGQGVQLGAVVSDSAGNALSGRSIGWSSSNTSVATVSGSGYVTAVGGGSATVSATSEGAVGTASITATVSVATVTISASRTSLNVGDTTQLTATTRDANGAVLTGRTIAWSSSAPGVAAVSGTGLVTAVGVGTATITATSEGRSGSVAMTVAAVAPPSGNGCTTIRAGWLWCDDFEQDRTASYFEYDRANGSFVRDGTAGRNGGTAMKAHFNTGQQSAGSLKLAFGRTPSSYFRPIDAGTANYREIYWRFYTRTGAGWSGGTGNKLSRATSFVAADWSQSMFAHIWSGSGADTNYLAIDPASGTDLAGNIVTHGYNDFAHMRWLGAVRSVTPIFDPRYIGRWFCVEGHARLNDAGQSNGLFEMWIDDRLESQRGGMNWVGSFSAYGINTVMLENYQQQGASQPEDRYFDDFVVSTQRIGCGA
ncbi:MAG TPA: Ig-like domain-containing protein [Gemmatimonadaceae bacterium]|nr:Ig-like domain-containing protein [Gemmatimonadaceae bacterium]